MPDLWLRFTDVLNGSSKRPFNCPTAPKSGIQNAAADTNFVDPILQDHRFAVERYDVVASIMTQLLGSCRPNAVCRTIVSVVIDTIQRVFWRWSPSNVCKEIRKSVFSKPAITNSYPSTTVIVEPDVFRVSAPFTHSAPNRKFCRVRQPVRYVTFGRGFPQQTTAALGSFLNKTVGNNGYFISAGASTEPICSISTGHTASFTAYNCQPSENLPDKINRFHGVSNRIVFELDKSIVRHIGEKVNV